MWINIYIFFTTPKPQLCHQVYYQSADRLRIGYQIEIELSEHSFLPVPMAEQVCKSMKVEIRNLMMGVAGGDGAEAKNCGGLLNFVDHRSTPMIIASGEGDDEAQKSRWIIKGYLEVSVFISRREGEL